MRLAVVTVNYCCAAEILRSLTATAAQIAASGGEWWIVDNKSPDGSSALLSDAVADLPNVHVLEAPKNGGFGYGNNQIITRLLSREIDAAYLYFLNPDAVPEPGAVEAMLAYLDEHEDVAVVGSALINEDGSHTDSMYRFPSFWSEIESALSFGPVSRLLRTRRQSLGRLERAASVDWVAGTSFMVRADVFRAVGGFDEEFFLYWEEVELCHRIRKAGFAIHGLPRARVRHLGGLTTGMHKRNGRIPAYWHESRNLYFRKTGTGGPLPFLNIATAAALAVGRCLEFLKEASPRNPHFLRDHIKYALKRKRH